MAIGTANTSSALYERLGGHPLVHYLSVAFSEKERIEKLKDEVDSYEGSLRQITIAYLLLFSLLSSSSEKSQALRRVVKDMSAKRIPWVSEVLAIHRNKSLISENSSSHAFTAQPNFTEAKRSATSDQHFSFDMTSAAGA